MGSVFVILRVVFTPLASPIVLGSHRMFVHAARALGWLVTAVSALQIAVVVYMAGVEVDSRLNISPLAHRHRLHCVVDFDHPIWLCLAIAQQ